MSNRRVVALCEVMWGWNSMTSDAGYTEIAPRHYHINPGNKTGSILYDWLGPRGMYYDELLVTNACKELVTGPTKRGTPDREWVHHNLTELKPFCLLLVCGRVAQKTYNPSDAKGARVIELPHPAARGWSRDSLAFARRLIQEGSADLECGLEGGRLVAERWIPF